MSHPTLILIYYASMLTLQNSLMSPAFLVAISLECTIMSRLSTHIEPEPLVRTWLVGAYFTHIAFQTL